MDNFEPQKKDKIFTKSFISKYLYIIVIGLVVLFGTSYSLTFFVQDKKITSGSLTTAPLNITFSNKGIDASNLTVPANDQEGINEYVKSLTITNTSAVDGNVKLTIDRTSGLQLSDLRYSLSVNGTIIKIDDMPSDGVILDTAIFSSETINVEVRLWPKPTYSGSTTIFQGDILSEVTYLKTLASSYSNLGNKYVNFNCDGTNCEVWRIVKVEDERLVLTRESDLSGATSRTNSGKYNPSLTFNDNSMITSVSTDNKNVYLAKTVKIKDGEGTQASPYNLINNEYSNEDEKVIATITYDNDGDTTTQPVYYGKTNYISQELDEEVFSGWTDNTNDYVLGDTVSFTTDTTLTAIIKHTLTAKIAQLCNDSSIDYVKPYTSDLGTTMDTYDGRGTKDVCYYTSTTSDDLAGQNGNVLFGGYCWQIIRTTDVGGVKLLYNGKAENNQCLTTRSADIGVIGSTGTQQTTLSGDKLYGAKFEIFDDSGTNKFRLLDTNTYNWSDSTYQNITGKYTCLNTADTCTELYYVGHYQSSTGASTEKYTIGTQAHYSQIGKSSYNAYIDSPALVGYMYNTTYNYKLKSNFTTSSNVINYDSTSASTAYFYGDKATWNTSTNMYDLTVDDGSGNDITPTTTTQWQNIRSTAQGMYTCRSTTATSCADVYYIVANMTNTYMPSVKLSNGEDFNKTVTWTVATDYTKSGNDYVLASPTTLTITLKDWYTGYGNSAYKNIYVCSDFTSSTCSELYYIGATSNYQITYNTSVNNYYFGNSVTYQNGSYTIDTNSDTTKYQQIWDWYKKYNTINNSHYTCFNSSDNTCGSSVYYVYCTDSTNAYYIELKNGKAVEDALKEMLNYKQNSTDTDEDINKYNSSIKGIVDNFYETKLSSTAKTFLDTSAVFCNDRAIRTNGLGGWNPTGETTAPNYYIKFTQYSSNRNLTCANVTDRFSTENKDAKLAYPIGILSGPERGLMYQYYAKTGQVYWVLSPDYFPGSSASMRYVAASGGIGGGAHVSVSYGARVSVSLRPDVEITGSGTYTDPYVIVGSN